MRTAFIDTLCDLADERRDIVLLCADIGFSVLERFAQRFPDRFFNVGVSEQNMMGMAAGLAASGKLVLTYSIANFAITRCLEQFRNDVCYHDLPVIAVSVGAGAAYGAQGYTHHGIEDMAFARVLPNIAVVSPGDPSEARWALRCLVERRKPASLRLGRGGEPVVHKDQISGPLREAIVLHPPGDDVTLLSNGSPLLESKAAAEHLTQSGYSVGLLSMPVVEPLDTYSVERAARRSRLLVSVEEHVTEGGFGGAVAEVLGGLGGYRARLIRAGIARNGAKTAADQYEIRRLNRFNAEGLADQTEQALRCMP